MAKPVKYTVTFALHLHEASAVKDIKEEIIFTLTELYSGEGMIKALKITKDA